MTSKLRQAAWGTKKKEEGIEKSGSASSSRSRAALVHGDGGSRTGEQGQDGCGCDRGSPPGDRLR